MRDYSELELIAKAATGFSDVSLAPDVVLGLIEEYKRVCELNHQQFGDAIRRNAERDQLKAAVEIAAKKLRSAEICHPRAVETLVGEAREALAAYLPAGWPESQVRP